MREPINTWEQVKLGHVFITYNAADSRACREAQWRVVGRGFKTCPDAAWYDNGCKCFTVDSPIREHKAAALAEAQAWASEEFGVKRWERNRSGDYVDADAGYPPLAVRRRR